jgi:twitching motility protein PilT
MQTGGQLGMQTLEKALANLVNKQIISAKEALSKASKPEELSRMLQIT